MVNTAQVSEETFRDDTYRNLRGGMVVMIVMLAVALVVQLIHGRHLQGSISAYYYTAAHSIFIAVLCALGILLLVYRGTKDSEDILLDLAGVMAFLVALVPTSRPDTIFGPGLPYDYKVPPGISNNVWALLVGLLVAKALSRFAASRKEGKPAPLTKYGKWAQKVFWFVTIAFTAAFFVIRPLFEKYGHNIAAVMLFVAVAVVVFINAYLVDKQDKEEPSRKAFYRRWYRLIGWSMVVTLPVTLLAHVILSRVIHGWDLTVLILEAALILEFAAFWAFQTFDLWDKADRNSMISPEVQNELAPL